MSNRAEIIKVLEKAERKKLTKWLQYQAEQLRRAVKNSRNAANEYRENINRNVESINSEVGELSSTNRAIQQAIEHIKSIVKQHEQAREQTRSKKI